MADQALGSWPSTNRPEIPSATAVLKPPTAVATTGVPQAWASSATSPNDSEYEGTQTKSLARYQSERSSCATGGRNSITSDTPKNHARPNNFSISP